MHASPRSPSTFFPIRLLSVAVLAMGVLFWTGCDSGGSDMGDEETEELRKISYELTAQSNDGALPEGVGGTVTFWEINAGQTVVTLELDEGEGGTGTEVAHPAHIHENSASEGGGISIYLTPIDGSGGAGTSARLINESIDALTDFNGHVNIHESVANLGTIVSQGDIGTNAEGEEDEGLELTADPRSATYDLAANANDGEVAPDGIPGQVSFQELTDDLTFVVLALDTDGATGASVSHPAHIHENSASEGGGIAFFLSPIDGTDEAAVSGKLVDASYDTLIESEGHVNIHESIANLGVIVSQGDVGASAESTSGSGSEDGY